LKHHSHTLKTTKQKDGCTAFDIDAGACGPTYSPSSTELSNAVVSANTLAAAQHSKADDALLPLLYCQGLASCKYGLDIKHGWWES
jgi:hypothetical protein